MIEIIGIACIAVIIIIAALAVAFEKGVIGLSPQRIAKIHEKGDALQAKLEARLAKKVKQVTAAPVMAAPAMSTDKAAKLAELNGMLIAGKITLEQHALMAKLLA